MYVRACERVFSLICRRAVLMDKTNQVLITQLELAKRFDVNRGTIINWAKRGHINPVRTVSGRMLGVWPSEIEKLEHTGQIPAIHESNRTRKEKRLRKGLQECAT